MLRIVLCLVGLGLFFGCNEKKEVKKSVSENIFAVKVVQAKKMKIPKSYKMIAIIKPLKSIDLIARVSGYLVKRNFKEGEFVKSGTVLYEIEQEPYQISVRQASAKLAQAKALYFNAKLQFKRTKELFDANISSQKKYDYALSQMNETSASIAEAEAQLAQAKLNLSYTQIIAPFDGWIGITKMYVGNYIQAPSKSLNELLLIDLVRIEFNLSDRYLLSELRNEITSNKIPEWKIYLNIDNKKYPYVGKINYWGNRISNNSATLTLQSEFPNPNHQLLPGQYVDVVMQSPKEKDYLVIDRRVIRYNLNQPYTYIVNAKNRLEFRPLKLGEIHGNYIVVKGGIKENENIAMAGNPMLRTNSQVKIVK